MNPKVKFLKRFIFVQAQTSCLCRLSIVCSLFSLTFKAYPYGLKLYD